MRGKPRVTRIAGACLGGALLLTGCAATPKEARLTPEQRRLNIESFEQVWSTVNDKYWDPQFGGVDWQAVQDELRPRIERASTESESRAILRDMIARLGKSHFMIIPAEVYRETTASDEVRPDGGTGIDLRVIDLHVLVTSVVEGSPADLVGVRPGWEIVRIGDLDIVPKLEKFASELEDDLSKPLRLAYAVIPRLWGRIGDTITLTFLDDRDRAVERELVLTEQRGRKSRFGNLGDIRVWIDVKKLDDNIGYIAFNGFFDPPHIMKTFNDAMRSFSEADGVVIDLRGNPGGMGAMAMGMAGWFVGEKRQLGTMRWRDREFKMIVQRRATTYDGPLVILVDGLSGSAAEFLSGGLQEFGRACIIGSRTKGEALPGQFTALPNGDVFLYATANFESAAGNTLEGLGVIPDIEAAPTRAALLDGRDPAVEAALRWIREQRPSNRASERQSSTTEVTTR